MILDISQKSLESTMMTFVIFLLECLPVRLHPIQNASGLRNLRRVLNNYCSCTILDMFLRSAINLSFIHQLRIWLRARACSYSSIWKTVPVLLSKSCSQRMQNFLFRVSKTNLPFKQFSTPNLTQSKETYYHISFRR